MGDVLQKKRFRQCILHIGTEKTGTKAIQDYLTIHRKNLRSEGVLYPVGSELDFASHWEFVAAVHHQPWEQDLGRFYNILNSDDQAAFRDQLQSNLEAEFDAAPSADTLLISSEHFQSRLKQFRNVEALRDFLEPWADTFKIIVYFRRQDQLALSLLSTRLKSSAQFKQKNIMAILRSSPRYYDYIGVYRKWSRAFGSDAIRARLYDPAHWLEGNLLADFCNVAGIKYRGHHDKVINRSLNRKGYQFLHALNNLTRVPYGDRSDPARESLVRAIARRYPGKYYPISRAQAEEFYQEFKRPNERLRALAFPDHPKPLFNEDFSEYPEQPNQAPPKYAEAVEVVYELWRDLHEQAPKQGHSFRKILRDIFVRK